MIVLSLLIGLAPLRITDRPDFQLMTSPAYAAFAARGDVVCPARKLRYLHPADLDGLEERFLPMLPRPVQHRIDVAARRATRACTGEGASCPAQNTLTAIVGTGRLDGFTRYACTTAP